MANIDDLSINVKSNVTSATNSIDKLIRKLGALSASLGQVNTSGFTQLASGVRQVGAATQTLNGTRAGNLTKTVNEINKFSTINAQQLTQVASAVQTLSYGLGTISNINANTNGINALAISIRKFGATTATQAANNIPRITQALQTLVYSMSNLGNVQINTQGLSNLINAISRLGGTRVGTAITQIPQVTQALQILIYSMAQMGNLNVNTAPLTQLVTAISRLGGVTATRAIQNIPQLTNALVQMINVLSQVPQVNYNTIQLVNALANLASNGARVNTVFNALNNGFNNFGRGAGNARKKAFSLAGAIGKLYANYWLLLRAFRGIGKGIDLASDLTEVQNVVDVSFGQYRDKIEDFASTSIQDYGMSELTAKQIASRFQAMGGAIGFAQGEMADMSIELTKLAADMASFYNVEQDAVAEDLAAIFTGQTRPLMIAA